MALADGISITSVKFNLSNGAEIDELAQFDLSWQTADSAWPVDVDAYELELATNVWEGWVANFDTSDFRGSVALAEVVARALLANGNTKAEQSYSAGTPWVGDNTSASLPWQCAYCIGIYAYEPNTFVVDGRNKRGRCYLPPFCVNRIDTANTGGIGSATTTALLTSMNGLMQQIVDNMSGAAATGPVVLSRVKQLAYPATWLRADNVIDTQRRRTRQEPKSVVRFELTG